MAKETQLLVFTDLDGTLLDHESYSWAPAKEAVDTLRQHHIPLIPVTSKTRAELESLRIALDNAHPYVVENGAATFIPEHYFENLDLYVKSEGEHCVTAGPTREALQEPIARARREQGFLFTSFFELGSRKIAELTGLSHEDAEKANCRTATEPLLWQDTDRRRIEFADFLGTLGVRCIAGGRFVHVLGKFDKADAVARLRGLYAKKYADKRLVCVALGDGPNDLKMLDYADIAVVIQGKHNHDMTLAKHEHVLRTQGSGPSSWNEAVLGIVRDLSRSTEH